MLVGLAFAMDIAKGWSSASYEEFCEQSCTTNFTAYNMAVQQHKKHYRELKKLGDFMASSMGITDTWESLNV